MKRSLLAYFFCFASLSLFAQIEIITEPQYDLQTDLSDEYSEPIAHSWVVNKGTQTIKLRWSLDNTNANCSSEWKFKICDKNQCYSSNVTSNVVAGGQPNVPVVLAPGDTSIIDLHLNPRFVAGCCVPTIHFSEISNINNPVDLGSATYSVCIENVSAVNEPELLAVKIYPNPSTGYFSISDNPLVKKVVLFNLLGRQVRSFVHTNGRQYDISDTPDGLYLVSMQDANGATIKTVRITKQGLRP